jgi:hypothetical protein
MNNIEFFKLRANELLQDYKTQHRDESGGYIYEPRFFDDVSNTIASCGISEDNKFTLMKAQHVISKLIGFKKWSELIIASEADLDEKKLLLEKFYKKGNLYERIISKNTSEQSNYHNSSLSGAVVFSCANNDGNYTIGDGENTFSLNWYTVGKNFAHIRMLNGKIGANTNYTNFPELTEIEKFDFSSFDRRLQANDIVICVNKSGRALAARLVSAKSRTHGDNHDEVTFEYKVY